MEKKTCVSFLLCSIAGLDAGSTTVDWVSLDHDEVRSPLGEDSSLVMSVHTQGKQFFFKVIYDMIMIISWQASGDAFIEITQMHSHAQYRHIMWLTGFGKTSEIFLYCWKRLCVWMWGSCHILPFIIAISAVIWKIVLSGHRNWMISDVHQITFSFWC